jgi:hypothetical protein
MQPSPTDTERRNCFKRRGERFVVWPRRNERIIQSRPVVIRKNEVRPRRAIPGSSRERFQAIFVMQPSQYRGCFHPMAMRNSTAV